MSSLPNPRAQATAESALMRVLAAVAENTASLVLITDADDRIEWVNPSFRRVTGWTLEEVAGRTPRSVLNGTDTEESPAWLRSHERRARGEAVSGAEIKLYRKDGSPYWAVVEVRPMHDDHGVLVHHLHLHTDVTERVVAERRVQESNRWLQLAGSVFGIGLWHTSLPDGVMLWDANLKRVFGLAKEDPTPPLGELLDRYVLPEDRRRVAHAANDVPAPGEHSEIEFRIRRGDGTLRTLVSRQTCVEYDTEGAPRRLLGAVLDVTEQRTMTVQLRDALRRLRLAAEASGIGAWERDLVSGEGSWDPTMFTLLGRLPAERAPSREETLAMVHPDDRAGVLDAWRRMADETRPVEYEYRIVRPDGEVVSIITRAIVERDANGEPRRAIGTAIDVTALRRAVRERDALADRIRLVAEAVGLGLWDWEPDSNRSRWNDRMYSLFGRRRDDFRERDWLQALHADDRVRIAELFERSSASGEAFDVEYRVVHPDGSLRWIASRGRGDFGGGQRRLVGVNWDITERVTMEQAALAAERHARDLLERMLLATSATGIGVWELEVGSGALHWDAQMYRLFGCQPEDGEPGALWQPAVHPEDLPLVQQLVEATVLRGDPYDAEFRVLHRDGTLRWLAGRGLVRDGARGRTVLGINWDVTERKLADGALRAKESAERASAAKSEFLSRMSHELRTPLNAILGFAQLLELDARQPLTKDQHERVDHIRQAGWHLLTLINEVLDLSRIEAGAARIEIGPVLLSGVIDECLALIAAEAQRQALTVTSQRMPGAPGAVMADRTRLKQVLLNLLSNAAKYNRSGGRIEVRVWAADGGRCTVAVRDTGHGLGSSQMDKLFQPFNRLGLDSAAVEGTGIGLSIALKLAEQMGGELTASSEPGVGSEFRLTLRAAEPAADRPGLAPAPAALAFESRADIAGSVLCIEDNPANMELVRQFVRLRPGITLFHARDGAEARMLAPVCQPDLVLLDLRLPDIHGLDLLRELRAMPALASVPCIALSANALESEIEQARRAGIADYLTKPLDVSAFLRSVDAVLDRH